MHLRAPIPLKTCLLNSPHIEVWPGGLLKARSNHDARHLARARAVLRRKRDGRYLAAALPDGLLPLVTRLAHEPGIEEAIALAQSLPQRRGFAVDAAGTLALAPLLSHMQQLGLDEGYGPRTGLVPVAEPAALAFAGLDRYQRPLWLSRAAASAWLRMQRHAAREGVLLEAISGYRSHAYQLGIFERKLARGQTVEEILAVNAAPGYSEHHGGRALDIGTPGEPAAEESFEHTPAFHWLGQHAVCHGFHMSYPRDNPHGIVYEPWHWRYDPAG